MTVREQPIVPARFNYNRAAAIIAWLGGAFLTYLFFAVTIPGLHWLVAFSFAALTQAVLTLAERPLWQRLARKSSRRLVPLAVIVTVIDAMLNAAGVYPYMGQMAKTGVGVMLADAFQVEPVLSTRTAIALAFALGLILAGIPEMLWEYDS